MISPFLCPLIPSISGCLCHWFKFDIWHLNTIVIYFSLPKVSVIPQESKPFAALLLLLVFFLLLLCYCSFLMKLFNMWDDIQQSVYWECNAWNPKTFCICWLSSSHMDCRPIIPLLPSVGYWSSVVSHVQLFNCRVRLENQTS